VELVDTGDLPILSVYMVTYRMNRANCEEALRASDAKAQSETINANALKNLEIG